jgi:hypothetical protein
MKSLFFLLILIAILTSISTQEKKNKTVIIYNLGNTTDKYLPDELFEKYHEYSILEEYNNTCNLENSIENQPHEKVQQRIKEGKCVPDYKSFMAILENGKLDIGKDLVLNYYLANSIDPTIPLYSTINKYENKAKYLDNLNLEHKFERVKLIYDYEDKDTAINFKAKLPDESYVLESYSIFCYKDMFKLNATFRNRNKIYKVTDAHTFYDQIEGDCEHSYNQFTSQFEVKMDKLNNYKRWETLFR